MKRLRDLAPVFEAPRSAELRYAMALRSVVEATDPDDPEAIEKAKEETSRFFVIMSLVLLRHGLEGGRTLIGPRYGNTGIDPVVAVVRERNLFLIEDVLRESKEVGLERSVMRAEKIAVDQVLRLQAALVRHRLTFSGVERYVWLTLRDDRVRPMHRELDGQEFDWLHPPVTNRAGERNHPGEDYRCRCLAIPVLE